MDPDPCGSGGSGFGSGSATLVEFLEKIRGLIFFWDRFRLSLPGRISVIKKTLDTAVKLYWLFSLSL